MMPEAHSAEQSSGWGTRIRALGFYAGAIVFVFIEALLVYIIADQLIVVVIDALLGHLHPIFREPLDPILADSDGTRSIPGTVHGWALRGCLVALILGYAHVRRRTVTWPYDKFTSAEMRAKLDAPTEKPSKPIAGWKAVIFFFFVELMLAFVVALPIAVFVLDPLIGVWSVAFWFTAPVGWFALRGVVALVRGRGPWPYVEKPNDVLYYLTAGVSI